MRIGCFKTLQEWAPALGKDQQEAGHGNGNGHDILVFLRLPSISLSPYSLHHMLLKLQANPQTSFCCLSERRPPGPFMYNSHALAVLQNAVHLPVDNINIRKELQHIDAFGWTFNMAHTFNKAVDVKLSVSSVINFEKCHQIMGIDIKCIEPCLQVGICYQGLEFVPRNNPIPIDVQVFESIFKLSAI